MLVIGMKKDSRVYVGDAGGYVILIDDRPGHIRIGFDFPRDVTVLREKFVDLKVVDSPVGDE